MLSSPSLSRPTDELFQGMDTPAMATDGTKALPMTKLTHMIATLHVRRGSIFKGFRVVRRVICVIFGRGRRGIVGWAMRRFRLGMGGKWNGWTL